MKSIAEMIADCNGLKHGELGPWERAFVETLAILQRNNHPINASSAESLERIHRKHFS